MVDTPGDLNRIFKDAFKPEYDPASKPYRIFRRAIAGSIAGVSERSTPQEISQALMRGAAR